MIRPRARRRRSGARCWLDQEPVRPFAGVTHHSPAAAVSLLQTGVDRTLRVGGSVGCLQTNWTTWSVSTRIATDTRSRSLPRRAAVWSRSGRCGRAHVGTPRPCGSLMSSRPGARVWAVEGAGHDGVGLVRYLSLHGETVLEGGRGPRNERRLRGKDDPLDAVRAARATLASERLALPRTGERREALRLLLIARRSAVEVRRRALVQLRSVIVTAPDPLRDQLRALPERRLLERCSRFRRSSSSPVDERAAKLVLPTLARRIEAATAEAEQLEREILGHVRVLAPRLLDEPGIGPIVAADLIVAWSHPGRVRTTRRRHAGPRLQRPDGPSSPQPWRRSSAESRPAHDRAAPTPTRRRNTSLRRATRGRAAAKPPACSSATSPATSSGYCNKPSH